MPNPYVPKQLTPEQLADLHALPNDALATAQEAAAFLRLTYGTLAWYRCQGGGPKFTRIGPKLIRYRMGDLRDYAKGQPMGDGMKRCAQAALVARGLSPKSEG
ncbi:MAG: DNA-binding protein [Candidatus Dactylopiibacterium carminicum]|uniref:DNA-binding protein n=1 Tax=Candidatus Dactylopiibacterium carminicum TaxID=857335 RepID=A0A272EQK7_9RHOO|nr:DNA-binding protein [Candidatus Dactylopiibacterium carminicum]KAF7598592.1 DNA-binding protein [Candidatus Dactylopiibacterium carminicum]PAS92346.1 MAG: DNA-binding protein [Candidatus Dactylopiibacterium carminicum]PAS98359.1 MAG: DNA-binding protein [Candidatus Dactylopiibacterium carminicum]